jgi:tRNA 2-thiouridine synthesizing protein A
VGDYAVFRVMVQGNASHAGFADQLQYVVPICRVFGIPAMDFTKEIDTRGLNCPLPILRAKKALAELESGQVLKVVATDPGSMRDFAAFSKQTGHGLLETSEANREYFFYLKKK